MPPSLPAPTLSDQSGLWACGQREDALPPGPTGATTGDYMIEKWHPCNRSTLSAMYPVEPKIAPSPHAGRGGASGTAPSCRRVISREMPDEHPQPRALHEASLAATAVAARLPAASGPATPATPPAEARRPAGRERAQRPGPARSSAW